MTANLGLKLKQTQQLNQSLQQSLRILQMSHLEIEREIEEWLLDNPLLERSEEDEFTDIHLDNPISAAQPSAHILNHPSENDEAWLNITEEEHLHQYLHVQVCEHPLSKKQATLVHAVIDFLDDNGYLTESLEEILEHLPLDWMVDEDELYDAIDILHTFDPAGVAATDLTQSLILQLMRLPQSPQRQLAARLVQNSLGDLAKNRQQNILRFRKMFPEYSTEIIEAALDMIAKLNPYPAYGFASPEPTVHIQPDVYVKKSNEGWKVMGNQSTSTKIRINTDYLDLIKEIDHTEPTWKEKIREAQQKINILELRQSTVIRLAEYIVEQQKDFFTFGEIGLVPMLLKDTATELELAESTISRAANQKYLACSRGVFALRYFFTQASNQDDDNEGISQGAVKALIAQMIEKEKSDKPYSDEALVQLLKQQGIELARRTVAKYRESLNIPPAHKRKLIR